MEALQWNSQPVLQHVDTHIHRHNAYAQARVAFFRLQPLPRRLSSSLFLCKMLQNCEDVMECLGDVAAMLSADGANDKVPARRLRPTPPARLFRMLLKCTKERPLVACPKCLLCFMIFSPPQCCPGHPPSTVTGMQVQQLRQAAAQVLEARHNAHLQCAALQELKGVYAAAQEPTDFEAALSGRAAAAAAAAP